MLNFQVTYIGLEVRLREIHFKCIYSIKKWCKLLIRNSFFFERVNFEKQQCPYKLSFLIINSSWILGSGGAHTIGAGYKWQFNLMFSWVLNISAQNWNKSLMNFLEPSKMLWRYVSVSWGYMTSNDVETNHNDMMVSSSRLDWPESARPICSF